MSNEYPGVFITCDTREQSALKLNHKTETAIKKDTYFISDYSAEEKRELAKKRPRIYSVYEHFSQKGAEVAIGKLDRCDYQISGEHRGFPVNIGVEYKHINDFAGSHADLPWKLWESAELFQDVALFVEGRIDIEQSGNFYYVKNWAGESVLRYDLMQSRLATWEAQGVHVRTFEKLAHFPINLENLIDYCAKSGHKSFEYKEPCAADLTLKMLMQVPGIKLYTVNKLLSGNPDMTFAELLGYDLKWMKGKIGKKTGEMLWRVLHDVDYKPSKVESLKSGEHSQ
ncbi:MAG: hypothetical protein M0R51_05925 [Clostridia bacterium]|jgi:hypothetical protein|nr:hypothetical protein [Clostridia bacterium]